MSNPEPRQRRQYRQIYVSPDMAGAVDSALPGFIGRAERRLSKLELCDVLLAVGLAHPDEVERKLREEMDQ